MIRRMVRCYLPFDVTYGLLRSDISFLPVWSQEEDCVLYFLAFYLAFGFCLPHLPTCCSTRAAAGSRSFISNARSSSSAFPLFYTNAYPGRLRHARATASWRLRSLFSASRRMRTAPNAPPPFFAAFVYLLRAVRGTRQDAEFTATRCWRCCGRISLTRRPHMRRPLFLSLMFFYARGWHRGQKAAHQPPSHRRVCRRPVRRQPSLPFPLPVQGRVLLFPRCPRAGGQNALPSHHRAAFYRASPRCGMGGRRTRRQRAIQYLPSISSATCGDFCGAFGLFRRRFVWFLERCGPVATFMPHSLSPSSWYFFFVFLFERGGEA